MDDISQMGSDISDALQQSTYILDASASASAHAVNVGVTNADLPVPFVARFEIL